MRARDQVDHGGDELVNHERADDDLLPFQSALFNQFILLVKKCDKFGPIVTTIALRSKNEPFTRSAQWSVI